MLEEESVGRLGLLSLSPIQGGHPTPPRIDELHGEGRFGHLEPRHRCGAPAVTRVRQVQSSQVDVRECGGLSSARGTLGIAALRVTVGELVGRELVAPLLLIAVRQPLVVVTARRAGSAGLRPQPVHHRDRLKVLLHHVVPHTAGQKDVGGHVLCVSRVRCDHRVRARGLHREDRVGRVVERVDRVVCGARVIGVLVEDVERDRPGPHVGRHVSVALAEAQEGQRVERLGLEVVGMVGGEALHLP